jgi:hypothetical protein
MDEDAGSRTVHSPEYLKANPLIYIDLNIEVQALYQLLEGRWRT